MTGRFRIWVGEENHRRGLVGGNRPGSLASGRSSSLAEELVGGVRTLGRNQRAGLKPLELVGGVRTSGRS